MKFKEKLAAVIFSAVCIGFIFLFFVWLPMKALEQEKECKKRGGIMIRDGCISARWK